jgi:hypothetical protein
VPAAVAVVALGVWVTGGLVTDDEGVARVLTGVWFAVAGAVAVLVSVRWRSLAVPVLAAYAVTAASIGGFLLYTSEVDKVVEEQVVVAGPDEGAAPTDAGSGTGGTGATAPSSAPRPAAVMRVASGTFVGKAHPTSGTATVLRRPDGSLVLTLTKLDTDPGPDLRVYLVKGNGEKVAGGVDLGALKGNKGTQQYVLPASVGAADAGAVVIWCRAFSVSFGVAALTA